MVVCDEGHSLLADRRERGNSADIVGPCCVCGAVTRLQEHGGPDKPMPGLGGRLFLVPPGLPDSNGLGGERDRSSARRPS